MVKRRTVIFAVLAAVVAIAAGCGSSSGDSSGGGSTPASSSGPVKLTMWWWGDQEAAGMKNFVADSVQKYEAAHPNITIDTVLQSTDNLMPNFTAAAKAKQGPDIEYRWGGIWNLQDAWDGNLAAVSDYIPQDELSHYLNASEDTSGGKVWTAPWYVQPSFPVLYRKDILKNAGVAVPTNWDEFLAACDTLNSKGITPIAGGVKDGWFGGWLYSIMGSQSLTSIDDLKEAVVGDKKFTDPEFAAWWSKLQEMIDHKCWNDDIGSQELYQAQQTWVDGKSAMTISAGTEVGNFVKQVGIDKVGVMAMPAYGDGIGAGKLGSTSQTLGISSWSPAQAGGRRLHHVPAHSRAAGRVLQGHRRAAGGRSVRLQHDHGAAGQGSVRHVQGRLAVPGELHSDGSRLEGQLRGRAADVRGQRVRPGGGSEHGEGDGPDQDDPA